MSRTTINDLVAVCAGVFGLALYAGLILVPAWTSYSRLWERLAASVLSLYVLAVLVGIGVAGGARRRLLLGLTDAENPSSDLAALDAITEAVESGAGLPEVVRAAGKALEASLAVTDAWGATLAVAARSPAEERALLSKGEGVSSIPLRVADAVVGHAAHARQNARRARRCSGCS